MSKYKPGQLVTIDHNVYRIRSSKGTLLATCTQCDISGVPSICRDCIEELGVYGYYEKVCGKQDS